MKLQEILNDRNIGIHCRTEEQARVLLSKLNALGLCWQTGDKYDSKDTHWSVFREYTYYRPGAGSYCSINWDYYDTIIEFEDVEFD